VTFGVEFSPGIDIYVTTLFRISANLVYTQATAVPLPAAAWLFSAGLLVLSSAKRRANGRGRKVIV